MDSVEVAVTPEMLAAIEDERRARESAVLARVQQKLETAIQGMKPAHDRAIGNIRQYEGMSRNVAPTKNDRNNENELGPPVLHATRSKTDLVEARISDMLLPSTQAQWRFDPEPVQSIDPQELFTPEELNVMVDADGNPLPEQALKEAFDVKVKESVREFEKLARDQFVEAKFPAIARRVIRDGCRIGFGAVLGPIDGVKQSESFCRVPCGDAMETRVTVDESVVPTVEYADPFMCFPEPVEDLADASYLHYLDLMPESRLREMADIPGANRENISELLAVKKIDHGSIGQIISHRNAMTNFTESLEGKYPVWRFYGAMSYEDMIAIGMECDPLDPPPMVQMWHCMGKPILMKPYSLRGRFRIPLHVFAPFPDVSGWVGLGVPYLCRDSARTAQGAWETAMLNAALSAGTIVFHRGDLVFSDGVSELNGPKFVRVQDNDAALGDQIRGEIIPNNAEQALMFLDRALAQMDEDINLPQWTNPEVNKPMNTASGLAMWSNAQTVVQRRTAAAWDDFIEPLIQGFVKWNKQYSDSPATKMDVQVVPLGQTELLVKDLQIQQAMAFLNMAQPGTALGNITDIEVVGRHVAHKFELPENAILTAEQVKQRAENQPPDPAAAAEQARAAAVEREAALAEARLAAETADKERDDAFRREDRELDHEERMQELALKRELAQLEVLKLRAAQEMKLMELAQNKELDIAKIQAQLQSHQLRKDAMEYQAGSAAAIKAQEIASRNREMVLKLSPINPTNTGI